MKTNTLYSEDFPQPVWVALVVLSNARAWIEKWVSQAETDIHELESRVIPVCAKAPYWNLRKKWNWLYYQYLVREYKGQLAFWKSKLEKFVLTEEKLRNEEYQPAIELLDWLSEMRPHDFPSLREGTEFICSVNLGVEYSRSPEQALKRLIKFTNQ